MCLHRPRRKKDKGVPIILPSIIKKKYRDLSEDEWISIDEYLPEELHGIYVVNKKCWLKNINNGRIWKPNTYKLNRSGYQIFTFHKKESRKTWLMHRLFAFLFLENDDPKHKTQVHHISIKTWELSLDNLAWVTPRENNLHRNESRDKTNYYYFKVYDRNGKFIEKRKFNKISISTRNYILKKIRESDGIYKKCKWELCDNRVDEYRKRWGKPHEGEWNTVTCRGWKPSRLYSNVLVNSNGYLKVNGILTVGTIKINDLYYKITIKGKRWDVHRLIWSEFHNSKLISKNIIDHLDAIYPVNNSIFNLRLTDTKGNRNNPNTLLKFRKRVSKIDISNINDIKIINYYPSLAIAGVIENCDHSSISKCCEGKIKLSNGYLWSWTGKEKERISKFLDLINSEERKPNGWWLIKENCYLEALKYKSRREFYLKNGSAYDVANKQGWLDEWFIDKRFNPGTKWDNKDVCKKEASKYNSRARFKEGSPWAYRIALKKKWMDEFFPKLK